MSGKHALTAGVGERLDPLDIGLGEERGWLVTRAFSLVPFFSRVWGIGDLLEVQVANNPAVLAEDLR